MNTTQKIIANFAKYPPSLFHSKDVEEAFHVASKAKFASIMLTTEPDMDILFSPFFNLYQENKEKILHAHLFRANPLYEYLK
jgi:predicted FMN-binding regulatory protein PaiB